MSGDPAVSRILTAIEPRLDATPLALLLDVDGTLAPIVQHPRDARVPAETRAVIQRLVSAPGVHVALVSGRGAQDAISMVAVPGVWAIGNHGLELRLPDGDIEPDPAAREYRPAIAAVARELDALAQQVEGAMLEDKHWTLSLHYRMVDGARVPWLVERAHDIVRRTSLRILDGKKIVEVRPPIAVDKGTASCALASRLGALGSGAGVLFAGDDRTDEDAFRALRQRAANAVTIRVGEEASDTAAEFRVQSTDDVRELLAAIAERRASAR